MRKEDIEEKYVKRFIEIYEQIPLVDGKKLWPYYRDSDGYGVYTVFLKNGKRKPFRAHRLVLIIFKGELDDNLIVMHKDDCPANVLLENLEIGTVQDNNNDKLKKGRARFNPNYLEALEKAKIAAAMPEVRARAMVKTHAAIRRFSEEDIRYIRLKRNEGVSLKELGAMFNCAISKISNICNYKSYAHIK